jgi:hypothetical protein
MLPIIATGRRRMNRFEQAIYDCMVPTERLLEETTKPLHRVVAAS